VRQRVQKGQYERRFHPLDDRTIRWDDRRFMSVRGLVPYAIAAILVAAGSSLAVVSTVHHVAGGAPTARATFPPGPTGARVADLSKSSRLAYWRESRLWVSNLDGSLRHAVTDRLTEEIRSISLTRWTADGGAISFVERGTTLSVVTTDGGRTAVAVPFE